MPTIRIPAPLRAQTAGRAEVRVGGATARAALAELAQRHPGVAERLFTADGRLQRFVNVFVGDEDVRDLQGLDTPVTDDDVVAVVPAVAGGAGGSGRGRTSGLAGRCRPVSSG